MQCHSVIYKNTRSESHTPLRGVNKILPLFSVFSSDVNKIQYYRCPNKIHGIAEFRENRRGDGRIFLRA